MSSGSGTTFWISARRPVRRIDPRVVRAGPKLGMPRNTNGFQSGCTWFCVSDCSPMRSKAETDWSQRDELRPPIETFVEEQHREQREHDAAHAVVSVNAPESSASGAGFVWAMGSCGSGFTRREAAPRSRAPCARPASQSMRTGQCASSFAIGRRVERRRERLAHGAVISRKGGSGALSRRSSNGVVSTGRPLARYWYTLFGLMPCERIVRAEGITRRPAPACRPAPARTDGDPAPDSLPAAQFGHRGVGRRRARPHQYQRAPAGSGEATPTSRSGKCDNNPT